MVIIFQVHQDIKEHTRVFRQNILITKLLTFFRRVLRSVPVLAAI